MLLNIPPEIPPDMLKLMWVMGHGSEMIIADGNFPAGECLSADKIFYLPTIGVAKMLQATLQLLPLDSYEANVVLMQPCEGHAQPKVWQDYDAVLKSNAANSFMVDTVKRFDFYERAKKASFIVVTGEQSPYANVLLKKGEVR